MPIISILITLIIVGLVLYLIETYIPMDAAIKTVIRVVIVLVLCLWLLNTFGVLGDYSVSRPLYKR